jgi:hypothetical protein
MIEMTRLNSEEKEELVRHRYKQLEGSLDERSRRLFAATEARTMGYGGISIVQRATGLSRQTIRSGLSELKQIEAGKPPVLKSGRVRQKGAGRKRKIEEPGLLEALRQIVESSTVGDPESALLWTARSQRNLIAELANEGFNVSTGLIGRLLTEIGYSRQANKKKMEGQQHPDRNAQFEHINERIRRQIKSGNPAISVDTKKKENVGNFKNAGKELRPKYDPEEVDAHDFMDKMLGKASPYGVYDIEKNNGWVSVGISHDTGEFAVNTIRTWWREMGEPLYPDATSILITADGGGSNGYRLRLWKIEIQKLANELGIPIEVCHYPPGTSKWNRIEHRLFAFITQNWRGKPLYSHHVIVNLIAATKTKQGLEVRCKVDGNHYAKGRRISDRELEKVNLIPESFHGEWNYTINPE